MINVKDTVEQTYTKSDLKAGMLVGLRQCLPRLVMPSKSGLCLISNDGYVEYLSAYTDDMKCLPCDSRDITEIYDIPEYGCDSLLFSTENRTPIWKRKEVREFSKKEAEIAIAKFLNISPEEVAILLK